MESDVRDALKQQELPITHTQGCIQLLDRAGALSHDLFSHLAGCAVWEEKSATDILVKKKGEIKLKISADEMQS